MYGASQGDDFASSIHLPYVPSCVYTCTGTRVLHAQTHTEAHACTHRRAQIHRSARTCTSAHAHTHTCTHMHAHAYVHAHVHAHAHTVRLSFVHCNNCSDSCMFISSIDWLHQPAIDLDFGRPTSNNYIPHRDGLPAGMYDLRPQAINHLSRMLGADL